MGSGKKKRERRQYLDQPDEFVSFWTRAGQELGKRSLPVGIATVAVVVIGAIYWGTTAAAESSRKEASLALGAALELRLAPLKEADDASDPVKVQLAKLRGDNTDADVPRYPTGKERAEAALAALDKILADQGGTRTAGSVRLARAGVLVELGRLDDAMKAYQELLQGPAAKEVGFLAHLGRAVVLEAQGKLDEALQELQSLETSDPFLAARAQFQQARLLQRKGDKAAAKSKLDGILEKWPSTPLREQIKLRLAAVAS